MTLYLGRRPVTGVLLAANPVLAGGWACLFTPQVFGINVEFEIHHIAVKDGPVGSSFQVFIDDAFYDVANRGDLNSWDPAQVMPVTPGQSVNFYWNSAAGTAPKVSVYCSQPSNGAV